MNLNQRRVSMFFTLWLITLLVMPRVSKAQNFDQLLQAVDRLEVSLKALVKQESVDRNKQIENLQTGLANLRKAKSGSVNNTLLANLKDEVARLNKDVSRLSQANQGEQTFSKSDWMTMVNDVEFLKSENLYLRSLLGNNPKQLASLNDGSFPDKEVSSALEERLTSLNESVDALIKKQQSMSSTPTAKHSASKTTVSGRMYSHGMADLSNSSQDYNEFALSRAYVTLKSKLSSYASIRVTSDLKPIDDKYNIILKYAYLDWQPSFTQNYAKVRFGLQATQYIDNMNKLWGRRYLEKTVSDQREFLTSSDLGVSTIIGLGQKSKYGFVSLALLNGASYSHVKELNSNKDFNLVSLVKPFKELPAFSKSTLIMQFYTGTQNKSLDNLQSVDSTGMPWDTTVTVVGSSDWKRQMFSIGGLLAWNSTLDVGFDMNFTTVGEGAQQEAVKKRGLSFFGTFYLNKLMEQTQFMNSLNFFGRVDLYDPNTNRNNDRETMGIVGIESVPVKGFKVALDYRFTNFQDSTVNGLSKLYVNTLFKF